MNLKEFDSLEILTFKNSKSEFRMHFHDAYVISLIEKGTFIENNLIGVSRNILISHPFEIHENKIFDDNAYTVTSMYINAEVIQYLSKQKYTSFTEKLINDLNLFTLFSHYLSTLNSSNLDSNNLLVEALKKLIFTYGKNTVIDDQQIKSSHITESQYYIEQNYHTKIKLDDLAIMAKQSKYSFIRQFKKNVGITPFEYINLQRIKQAKVYLRGGASLVETALSTGFYDQSHFSHYFKHYVGLSPSDYVNSNILQDI
jgi:AraC-like DNA-binding protein